jgi:hypothetical protein
MEASRGAIISASLDLFECVGTSNKSRKSAMHHPRIRSANSSRPRLQPLQALLPAFRRSGRLAEYVNAALYEGAEEILAAALRQR